VGVLGGSWELITSKMALGFYRVFVINLIVYSCFTLYMESLDCVHKISFFGCVKYFHNFINGSHGVLLSSRWAAKLDFHTLYLKSWKCSLYLLWNDLPIWPTHFM
jgi:hypothetical protein